MKLPSPSTLGREHPLFSQLEKRVLEERREKERKRERGEERGKERKETMMKEKVGEGGREGRAKTEWEKRRGEKRGARKTGDRRRGEEREVWERERKRTTTRIVSRSLVIRLNAAFHGAGPF